MGKFSERTPRCLRPLSRSPAARPGPTLRCEGGAAGRSYLSLSPSVFRRMFLYLSLFPISLEQPEKAL